MQIAAMANILHCNLQRKCDAQLHVQEVDCQLQIPLEPVDVWSSWKYNLILTDLWEKKDV